MIFDAQTNREGGHPFVMKLFWKKKSILQRFTTKAITMNKDNIISLKNPVENLDFLTGLLRPGAIELIAQAAQAVTFPRFIWIGSFDYDL